jgi:hypothetical protein
VRNTEVRAYQAVLAIGSVCLVSGFHWFWSIGACIDDSGRDQTYLYECWAYDAPRATWWEAEALLVFLGPAAIVIVGAVFGAAMRMPEILVVATAISLTLAAAGFFTAPLFFD